MIHILDENDWWIQGDVTSAHSKRTEFVLFNSIFPEVTASKVGANSLLYICDILCFIVCNFNQTVQPLFFFQ